MSKNWIVHLIFLATLYSALPIQALGIQENLDLRRIAEYWKEGDFEVVKTQIDDYLAKHPESSYKDHLFAMLGDLYFKESQFEQALKAYQMITGKEFKEKTAFSSLHSAYSLKDYTQAIASAKAFLEIPSNTKDAENTARFEMADSYYRLGLQATSEIKTALFKQALENYLVLASTTQADQCLFPLAELHTYFKEYPQASKCYLLLSQKYPEKKEELLFQTATFQLHFDKSAAADTFEKIYLLEGPKAPLAAFNQLTLLFGEKAYKELLGSKEKALKYIAAEELPIVHYYIGKSFIATGDYSNAIASLKRASESKQTLLALSLCAKKTQNLELFNQVLSRVKTLFPPSEELSAILLLHAQLCTEKKDSLAAQQDFKELLELFPEHPQREAITYDYALLLTESKQWESATELFQSLLNQFPSGVKSDNIWRHLTVCQLETVKATSGEAQKLKKGELTKTLSQALANGKIFANAEKKQMRYLNGKTLYEIGRYDEAILELENYVREYPKDPSCKQAYLVIADSYLKGSDDKLLFTVNAEKALALNAYLFEKEALHLQLYNAYLTLAAKEEEGKSELIAKAADHLFGALDQPVKKENLVWLAQYYHNQLTHAPLEKKSTYLSRSISVFEKLIGSILSCEKEAQILTLCDLYTQAGFHEKKNTLLQALKKEQDHSPNQGWRYARLALFELAKSYEMLGDSKNALDGYDFLIQSAAHASSYFGTAAQLQKTLLQYSLNPSASQNTLDQLKDLEIRRKLLSEPIHLEAALHYIEIKSSLSSENDRLRTQLKLFDHMKTSFNHQEDPLVQQYFGVKGRFEDKMKIFQHYMQYLSSEELRIQGEIALKNQKEEHANELFLQAELQLEELAKVTMHPLLENRVRRSQEAKPNVL